MSLILEPTEENAGYHNSIYRGLFLGSEVNDEQYSAIKNGTFNDMYIGDYWIINDITWVIAHFDYWYNTGDTNCIKHHVVLMPEQILYKAKMNDNNIVTGGYISSKMYATNLNQAKQIFNNAFESSHILVHRNLLTNAASNQATGWAWHDSTIELMNENMIAGSPIFGTVGYETGIDRSKLALFNFKNISDETFWLRSIGSSTGFSSLSKKGDIILSTASTELGVKPIGGICS